MPEGKINTQVRQKQFKSGEGRHVMARWHAALGKGVFLLAPVLAEKVFIACASAVLKGLENIWLGVYLQN